MNKTELVAAIADKTELSKKRQRKGIKGIYRCCRRRIKEGRKKSS